MSEPAKHREIIASAYDENGVFLRAVREGNRYRLESIGEAWTPQAGRISHSRYMSREAAIEAVEREQDEAGWVCGGSPPRVGG